MAEERDPADVAADKYEARTRTRREVGDTAVNFHALPGGKNNPVHSAPAPFMDSEDSRHRDMAKHSADFLTAVVKGDRGKAEAARTAFHEVRARSRGVPKGMEAPCPSGGCKRANTEGVTCEATGGCKPIGGNPLNVRRPRD